MANLTCALPFGPALGHVIVSYSGWYLSHGEQGTVSSETMLAIALPWPILLDSTSHPPADNDPDMSLLILLTCQT